MQRIHNSSDVAALHREGYYNATDFDLLTVAKVLNNEPMYDALRWPAMLTTDAAAKAIDDAAEAVGDPCRPFMTPLDLAAIRKQARDWLKEHGTTLIAIKRDYNNMDYISLYALGLRTITYYNVPEILADLIARTGKYDARELMEA